MMKVVLDPGISAHRGERSDWEHNKLFKTGRAFPSCSGAFKIVA